MTIERSGGHEDPSMVVAVYGMDYSQEEVFETGD
jgi:hypothetical protein